MWMTEVFISCHGIKFCKPKHLGGLGIHDLRLRRTAYIASLAARFLLHPTSLWVQLVTHIYKFPGRWANYKPPRKSSTIWHLIPKSAWVVQDALQWQVADGSKVTIMNDAWISSVPLCQLSALINSSLLREDEVVSLLLGPGQCNLATLSEYFNQDLVSSTTSISLLQSITKDCCT